MQQANRASTDNTARQPTRVVGGGQTHKRGHEYTTLSASSSSNDNSSNGTPLHVASPPSPASLPLSHTHINTASVRSRTGTSCAYTFSLLRIHASHRCIAKLCAYTPTAQLVYHARRCCVYTFDFLCTSHPIVCIRIADRAKEAKCLFFVHMYANLCQRIHMYTNFRQQNAKYTKTPTHTQKHCCVYTSELQSYI